MENSCKTNKPFKVSLLISDRKQNLKKYGPFTSAFVCFSSESLTQMEAISSTCDGYRISLSETSLLLSESNNSCRSTVTALSPMYSTVIKQKIMMQYLIYRKPHLLNYILANSIFLKYIIVPGPYNTGTRNTM